MNKIIILLLLSYVMPSSALAAEVRGPSLDDTLKFIQQKSKYDSSCHFDKYKYSYDLDYDNCKITQKRIIDMPNTTGINTDKATEQAICSSDYILNDIDSKSVTVTNPAGWEDCNTEMWQVNFKTITGEALIVDRCSSSKDETRFSQAAISTTNRDSAERIAKALRHAIMLCTKNNNKRELF